MSLTFALTAVVFLGAGGGWETRSSFGGNESGLGYGLVLGVPFTVGQFGVRGAVGFEKLSLTRTWETFDTTQAAVLEVGSGSGSAHPVMEANVVGLYVAAGRPLLKGFGLEMEIALLRALSSRRELGVPGQFRPEGSYLLASGGLFATKGLGEFFSIRLGGRYITGGSKDRPGSMFWLGGGLGLTFEL